MAIEFVESTLEVDKKEPKVRRKGIALPFRANKAGQIVLSEGQQLDEEDILVSLLSEDNNNAFMQGNGVKEDYMFSPNLQQSSADIFEQVKEVFERFENQHRFKLVEDTIQIIQDEGDIIFTFNYENLENNEMRNFSLKF